MPKTPGDNSAVVPQEKGNAGPMTHRMQRQAGVPQLSLVIPSYDRARMLAAALESVAASEGLAGNGLEVVVVDNGSRDETPAVVSTLSARYPFALRYLFEARPGALHAYNRGWGAARGTTIVFMDDDQLIDPRYLARVQPLFEATGADVLGGPIRFRDHHRAPEWLRRRTELVGQIDLGPETRDVTANDVPLKGGNLAVRRCVLAQLNGFSQAFQIDAGGSRLAPGFEDDFQARVRAHGGRVVYSPDLQQFNRFTPAQLRKAYWRRHAYDLGRGAFRLNADAWRRGRLVLGMPAWLFKRGLRSLGGCLRGLATGCEADRFDREHELCYCAGLLVQAWHHRALSDGGERESSVPANR